MTQAVKVVRGMCWAVSLPVDEKPEKNADVFESLTRVRHQGSNGLARRVELSRTGFGNEVRTDVASFPTFCEKDCKSVKGSIRYPVRVHQV